MRLLSRSRTSEMRHPGHGAKPGRAAMVSDRAAARWMPVPPGGTNRTPRYEIEISCRISFLRCTKTGQRIVHPLLVTRGGAVWQLVGLITRRSQVQILPPQPHKALKIKGFFFSWLFCSILYGSNLVRPVTTKLRQFATSQNSNCIDTPSRVY